jgi:hypothetical protein
VSSLFEGLSEEDKVFLRERTQKTLDAPAERRLRNITARESQHIAMLIETFLERDSAFLFALSAGINLIAKRKYKRGE